MKLDGLNTELILVDNLNCLVGMTLFSSISGKTANYIKSGYRSAKSTTV